MDLNRPAYRVETSRLVMRCWSPDDATAVRAAIDASARALKPWIPFMKEEPRSLVETGDWLRRHRAHFDLGLGFRYGVFDRQEAAVIGENMLLHRVGPDALEIGYWTRTGREGQGYASEATCAMVRVAFEVHAARRVEIHCAPGNAASAAIPAKLGFTHEATLRERTEDHLGQWHDLMIWTLLASEYAASPAARVEVAAFDALGEPLF